MKSCRAFLLFVSFALVGGCGGGASETCSQMAACAVGNGSYKLCTTGANASCRYVASDGTSFACGSCADCTAAAMKVVAWCSGSGSGGGTGGTDGGGTGGSGGGTGGSGGGGGTTAGCVTSTVCANSAKDCPAGQRCNAALNPPVCQALYCGDVGSPCGGDSPNDICASRMCVGGVCAAPPDMAVISGSCCTPGHMGNELGVGQYCSQSVTCSVQGTICTTVSGQTTNGFCTKICMAGDSCGTNATCMVGSGSTMGACVPTNCTVTGCT